MKTRLLILLCFLFPLFLSAQTTTDSTPPVTGRTPPATTVTTRTPPAPATKDTLQKAQTELTIARLQQDTKRLQDSIARLTQSSTVICHKCEGDTTAWTFFIFAIALLFLLVMLRVIFSKSFNLREALSENITDKLIKPNPKYDEATLRKWLDDLLTKNKEALRTEADRLQARADDAAKVRDQALEDFNALQGKGADANALSQSRTTLDAARQTADKADSEAREAMKTAATGTINPALIANLSALFPTTIEESEKGSYRPSTSRLIAFLSGILILIVGLGMTCFYMYYYMNTGCPPDLSNLTGVLIILGIGMAPYTINKVAATINKS